MMTKEGIKNANHNTALQALCREYLSRLRYMAAKHGLRGWINATIRANRRGECESTEKEVMMLARLCNDERLARLEVPKALGKSYRQCTQDEDFDKIKKLPYVGIFSKVSTLLHKAKSDFLLKKP